jgi:hypothetical protein
MRRMNAERDARRDARNQSLMEDIIAEMPEEYTQPNGKRNLQATHPSFFPRLIPTGRGAGAGAGRRRTDGRRAAEA